jgi:type I restriction enzyme S subunit
MTEEVKKGWKKVKLGVVATEIRETYEPNSGEHLRYIGLEHIGQQTLKLNGVGASSTTQSTKKIFEPNDILFGSLRPYFRKVVKPKFSGVCSTDITVIRSKEICQQDFLFYFIANQAFIDFATNYAIGTRMPRANWKVLSKSEWLFPPIETQRKIAAILLAYDDLIENNTRRVKILEEMAQTIYREWFVKFRFPGHEKVKMVDSELGPIPEGWMVKPSSQVLEINPRINVNKESEKPFVFMEDVSNTSMVIRCRTRREGLSGSKFQNGDTVFARITPSLENGKIGFVQFLSSDNEVGLGSTEFIVLRSKHLCPEYVYLLARTEKFRGNAIKSMIGASGRQRVQEACFDHFFLAVPPPSKTERFHGYIAPIFKNIHLLSLKNGILRRTRDLLMPKLISGEVDVAEIDLNVKNIVVES